MTTDKQRDPNRAYVLADGRAYPPQRRVTAVKRGHDLTHGHPSPPLTPLRFRWIAVAADR